MCKCSVKGCIGEYQHRQITHTVRRENELVVIDHVPAQVCSVCGDVLLDASTVRGLERLLASNARPAGTAPVYDYAAAPD